MKRRLRVGVIGAGGIAERHIGNLVGLGNARMVGVADPILDRAREQADRAGADAYEDWRDLLEQARPDALLICVPPFGHGEPEIAAARRGIPFFVEKPIATDVESAERVAEAVATAGVPTGVGYHWRYLDTVERARQELVARPARLGAGYWWDQTPPREWWVHQATSGGQMVEQTTHIFDLARYLVGEAVRVTAVGRRVERADPPFPDADVDDLTVATVEFASGAVITFSSTSLLRWAHRVGLHLVSERMVIELSEFELMLDVGEGRPVTTATVDPFDAELRDFLTAAAGGPDRIRAPYAEAMRTQRLTVAATRSAREGQRVDLDPTPEAEPPKRPVGRAATVARGARGTG
jgi:predicted dehydrogenase